MRNVLKLLLAAAVSAILLTSVRWRLATSAGVATKLPVLMYHHLLKESSRLGTYTIAPQELREDLLYLQREGYTPVLLEDLLAFAYDGRPLPEKPILLTFDDGYESFYAYAYPLLQEFSMPAVLSVIGVYADRYTDKPDHHINYSHCTWQQLREMQESGLVEIANHSYDLHRSTGMRRGSMMVSGESEEQYASMLRADLGRMQAQCDTWLGKTPTAFAYPFGFVSPESRDILKDMGFLISFSCAERSNILTGQPAELLGLCRYNRRHGLSAKAILEASAHN